MNRQGSLTIEASIGIFMIILLFAFIISIMNILFVNEVVNQGLYQTAMETSSLKGMDYTLYESTVSKGLMVGSIQRQLKSNTKYEVFDQLDEKQLMIDYDYDLNQGVIRLTYTDHLIGQSIEKTKAIHFTSFLHKSLSIRTLESKFVYVTNTGDKYHKADCFYLRKSKIKITLKEAIKQGYTPCSKCYFTGH